MKRIKSTILTCVMAAAMFTACGAEKAEPPISETTAETTVSETTTVETTTTAEITTTEETTTAAPEFVPCDFAELNFIKRTTEYTYGIYGWDFFIKNKSENPITKMKVAVMGFNKDFLPVTEQPVENEFQPNLLPNEERDFAMVQLASDDGSDGYYYGDYFTGIITYVKFRNGEEWNAENIDIWTKDVYENFGYNEWLSHRDTLKEKALLAEKNEYLENLKGIYVADPSYDEKNDLGVFWKQPDNFSSNIRKYSATIIFYDKEGKYLNKEWLSMSKDSIDKFIRTGYDPGVYLKVKNVTPNNLGYTKNIITKIVFADGSEWENEYAGKWEYYNEYDLDM